MQKALITNDGYLFLEILDGSGDLSDGDMTVSFLSLKHELDMEGTAYRVIYDVDAVASLRARVAAIRSAMLVNC